ncbi:tyrosine protein kinase, partial [Oxalobacteraceae bacterium OM1]
MNQSIPQLPGPAPVYHQQEEEVELATYFDILWESRWLIATITFLFALAGIAYAFLSTPVYQSNMLIHVQEEGQKESKNIVGDLNSMFDVKTSALAEMELLHSRLVVSRAIDNLRLYISAQPQYLPVVGSWLAKHSKSLSTPGVFGYGGWVHGTEKIDVSTFNVPDTLLGKEFILTAEGNGNYRIAQEDQGIAFKGRVGEQVELETPKGLIELRVDKLEGKPGAEFKLSRASRLATIESFQNAMKTEELGGKQSGVVNVTLQGTDPAVVSSVLGEVGKEYMKQNTSRKTEEAEKSLAYLNKQLPEIKTTLEQAEAKYNEFRNKNGTVDLSEESKLSLQQSSTAKLKKMDLLQKRTELLAKYTTEHPLVQGIDSQIRELNGEINSMNEHIKSLPNIEQNLLRLQRDVK